jgi:AcrR family transcriptional regulator
MTALSSTVRRPAVQRAAPPRTDRKDAILLAAERLFAQHGYHAVTIRQIAHEAGVPLALVGYYYGQKHELFEAIFERWSPTIDERLQALRAAVDAGGRDLLRHIVEAFVGPVLRLRASAEGQAYARLVARELAYASDDADRVLKRWFDPMAQAFVAALQAAMPGATRVQAAWGYQFALGALVHHLSDSRVERLSLNKARANAPEAAPMLVDFIVAGLRALCPPAPPPKTRTPPLPRTTPTRRPSP